MKPRPEIREVPNPDLDRVDTNGHYMKDNCRFIEREENIRRYFTDE